MLCLLLVCVSHVTRAQITISGFVYDSATGEWLMGATVQQKATYYGTTTNAYGYFSIKLSSEKSPVLIFSFTGYQPMQMRCNASKDTTLRIKLSPGITLNEFKVQGKGMQNNVLDVESGYRISIPSMKRLPSFGGEVDLLKTLQLLPGVQGGLEGRGSLHVRGGDADQNLVLFDDVPVYYLHHLGGFVSMFNDDALHSANLITSAFPAQYGSRLSSILDVRVKDGNMKEFKGAGAIGLLSAKLMFEGPIVKDKLSYMVSYRRFFYDAITRPATHLINEGDPIFTYNFYDLNAKLNWRISDRDKVYLSFYNGDDRFFMKTKDNEVNYESIAKNRWGNSIASLRWNHLIHQNLFSNTTLSFSGYRFIYRTNDNLPGRSQQVTYLSSVNDFRAKTDFNLSVSQKYKLLFGGEFTYHHFKPAIMNVYVSTPDSSYLKSAPGTIQHFASETTLYAENHFTFNHWLKTNLGIRLSSYYTENTLFVNPEPRIDVTFTPFRNFTIKPSYTFMTQYAHLLTGSGMGLPSDIWLPSTLKLLPSKSQQASASFTYTFSNKELAFRMEPYYKTMNNMVTLKPGIANLMGTGYWQNKVETGGLGRSKGIEFLFEKNGGRHTGWIAYTFSKTERSFTSIDNGEWYPYTYDRNHVLNVVYKIRLSKKVDFGATWIYTTGQAMSLPVAQYTSVMNRPPPDWGEMDGSDNASYTPIYIYSKKNAIRMKPYHRLDLSFNFHKKKRWGERVWNISVYNAYLNMNPYYYFYKYNITNNDDGTSVRAPNLYKQTLFGLIPSVSYSCKF